jgi:hypothetical protein
MKNTHIYIYIEHGIVSWIYAEIVKPEGQP